MFISKKTVLIAASGVSFFTLLCFFDNVLAWTEPATSAPNQNIFVPLNIGSNNQTKSGKLNIGPGLNYWIAKNGDSFALENNALATQLVIGQDGNIGIGTVTPGAKLEVAGQVKITGGAPGLNKVLTSDATGLAAWQTPVGGGLGGSGTVNYIAKFTGANALDNSQIFDNGANVGIGTETPASKLDVNGNISGTGFCIGADCRAAWPTSITPSACATGSFMTGINDLGQAICAPVALFYWTPNPCQTGLPANGKRIFVTSQTFIGSQIISEASADGKCQTAANAASYPGTYKALVYLRSRVPSDVLAAGKTFWNPAKSGSDGTSCAWNLVATSPSDFFIAKSGGNYLQNPIIFNEQGLAVSNLTVWTNFKATGIGIASADVAVVSGSGYSSVSCEFSYTSGPCFTKLNYSTGLNTRYASANHFYGINSLTSASWIYNSLCGSVCGSGACACPYQSSSTQPLCTNFAALLQNAANLCHNFSRALYCVEQ